MNAVHRSCAAGNIGRSEKIGDWAVLHVLSLTLTLSLFIIALCAARPETPVFGHQCSIMVLRIEQLKIQQSQRLLLTDDLTNRCGRKSVSHRASGILFKIGRHPTRLKYWSSWMMSISILVFAFMTTIPRLFSPREQFAMSGLVMMIQLQ
jgi:hypothetical protein